jgi:hypothetical protein
VARLALQERHPDVASVPPATELSPALLEQWQRNATSVRERAARANFLSSSSSSSYPSSFPPPRIALHTTVPPRHDPSTGAAEKPYLGRRYFLEQLNAACRSVAQTTGLGLVDYAALALRWSDNQSALRDQIHPGRPVALEAANLWLNLADQERRRQEGLRPAEEALALAGDAEAGAAAAAAGLAADAGGE